LTDQNAERVQRPAIQDGGVCADGYRHGGMPVQSENASGLLIKTLERLLAISGADMAATLTDACNAIGDALAADKVDAFLYDDSRDSLVAVGTSSTPLSSLQKKLGLNVLQVSNGGRVVYVFESGETFLTGRLLEDPVEVRGVKDGLKVQSKIGIPLNVGGRRRGVIMIASQEADYFNQSDAEFAECVTRFVALVIDRADLVHEITRNAFEEGRREVAEELITVLAHDLRNYIAPLDSRLLLIRTRAEKDSRKEDLRDVQASLSAVSRLKDLIEDILDVARVDHGLLHFDIQPVDLIQAARQIADALSTPEHEVVVIAEEEVIVAADVRRLKQCVENIVANAIRHSPAQAPVRLTVRAERRDDHNWGTLEVRNEGAGISADILPRIFERFVASRESPGLGLGLYLAQRITVAQGGRLTVQSDPGDGARFILHLPAFETAS
jgi:two-component system, OmpR family, sensor kinase